MQSLLDFLATYEGNELLYVDLGMASSELVEHIKKLSDVDVSGYFLIIDNYAIRHAQVRHSNVEIERSRRQLVVRNEDFNLIESIIAGYDRLFYEFARQKHTLIFEKSFPRGTYIYAAEIRVGKRKRICSQSLRILDTKKAD